MTADLRVAKFVDEDIGGKLPGWMELSGGTWKRCMTRHTETNV